MKEHSRALIMVIGDYMRTKVGDCMQAVVGWELHGLCALEACMEVVNPRCIGLGGQVESSACIGSAGQVEFSNSEGRLSNDAFTVDANELSTRSTPG